MVHHMAASPPCSGSGLAADPAAAGKVVGQLTAQIVAAFVHVPLSLGVRCLGVQVAGDKSWQDAAASLQSGIAAFAGVCLLSWQLACMQRWQIFSSSGMCRA